MSKKLLFIVSNSQHITALLPTLEKLFPQDEFNFMSLNGIGLRNYDYPDDLNFEDYPYVGKPLSKEPLSHPLIPNPYKKKLVDADEIIFACEPRPAFVMAFYMALAMFLGIDKAQAHYRAVIGDTIVSTSEAWFAEKLQYGIASRYFHYNFSVNSKELLGRVMQHLGIAPDSFVLIYSDLNILYLLASQQNPRRFSWIYQQLNHWQGTGKYISENQPFISPIPLFKLRHTLNSMIKRDLITNHEKVYALSATGKQLLELLEPSCDNPDLPYQLHQWCEQGMESKLEMDTYLKTVFGRQKKHIEHLV